MTNIKQNQFLSMWVDVTFGNLYEFGTQSEYIPIFARQLPDMIRINFYPSHPVNLNNHPRL